MFAVRPLSSAVTRTARAFHATTATMVKVGDSLPDVTLYKDTPGGAVKVRELCAGKKVVFFGVPGAFTPGCSKTHLPGFVADADKIKAKGVDAIACVSVNDPFVMAAWGEAQGAGDKVLMLADTTGALVKALDLAFDATPILGNVRSKRFSMVVEDNTVKVVDIEPDNTGMTCSLANPLIAQL